MLLKFFPKYTNMLEQMEERRQLELADIIAVASHVGNSKKSNAAYTRWRRHKLDRIEELKDIADFENKTVFEKLKASKVKKSNTVFDRLKRFKNGV